MGRVEKKGGLLQRIVSSNGELLWCRGWEATQPHAAQAAAAGCAGGSAQQLGHLICYAMRSSDPKACTARLRAFFAVSAECCALSSLSTQSGPQQQQPGAGDSSRVQACKVVPKS